MSTTRLLELLDTPAPAVSAADAVRIAETGYGIKAAAKPLDSDRDSNFLLYTDDGPVAAIKIANAAEDPAVFDLQNRALLHIESTDPSLPVPRLRFTRDGQMHFLLHTDSGESHLVRVLSWLVGDIFSRHQVAAELTRATGAMLARLGRALRDFFHSAADHQLVWDIKNVLQLKGLLEALSDPQLKALTGRALDRFESRVQPHLGSLRSQVVHGDLNQANVLVGQHDPLKPAGIIDFGDLVQTQLINDLAVAAAYQVGQDDDPLISALPLINGYHEVTPLEPVEIELLPELVMARLTASILIANWRASKHPENRDYILVDNQASRLRLAAMDAVPRDRLLQQLRQVCGNARPVQLP